MSAHAYTEDKLVEQPAKRLLAELCWSLGQPHPHLGPLPEGEEAPAWVDETGLFGRETKGEVVLVSRLRAALERLNPALPPEAITTAQCGISVDQNSSSASKRSQKPVESTSAVPTGHGPFLAELMSHLRVAHLKAALPANRELSAHGYERPLEAGALDVPSRNRQSWGAAQPV